MNIEERFNAVNDEYLVFEKVEHKRSNRPDIHAFILLDELFPKPNTDIVCCATHDEIWLDIGTGQLDILTYEQIMELVRCGVRYDSGSDCLAMFV